MHRLYEIRKKVSAYIRENNMLEYGDTVVAGVSGGADSMCLLGLLLELREEYGLKLAAVHVHHGIRGAEADGDMAYVKSFCGENGVDFHGISYNIPMIAREERLSEEEAGRIKRYEAFETALGEMGARDKGKIAVAHNMDDNSETFLLNLFRGTGLKGLSGIPPVRGHIIRPVRCLTRQEILGYLELKAIKYRVDSTNEETGYTRNRIRLELLPYIAEHINESAASNINRAADMLEELNRYMEAQADAACAKYVSGGTPGERCRLDGGLWREDAVIVKMVIRKAVEMTAGMLKDISAFHIESIAKLWDNTVSKAVDIPYGIRAVRTYDGIELRRRMKNRAEETAERRTENRAEETAERRTENRAEETAEKRTENRAEASDIVSVNISALTMEAGNGEETGGRIIVKAGEGRMTFRIEKNKCIDLSEKIYTKWMNYDILKGNLSVRTRAAGDYMVIGAEGQRKKLKDIFIDMKVPRDERDSIVLLAKGSEILWIVGGRMSERCKLHTDMSGSVTDMAVRVEYSAQ